MKLIALDIPNDPADWPDWLERQLVGLELGELVLQLQVFAGSSDESKPTLDEVCGSNIETVLQGGLAPLSQQQLGSLLKHPHLLLELQQRVLFEGGEYWSNVPISQEHQQRVADAQPRILSQIAAGDAEIPSWQKDDVDRSASRRGGSWLPLIAVAATVLISIAFWLSRPPVTGWGFNRSGVLTADLPPDQYLDQLAVAADDWFNQRPDTREALAQRLQQFSEGCQTLIEAPHPQLSPEDRAWLIERCQVWKGKIDNQLADLNAGAKSIEEVRAAADQTINTLIKALRSHEVST